jgi:hypothetical protein
VRCSDFAPPRGHQASMSAAAAAAAAAAAPRRGAPETGAARATYRARASGETSAAASVAPGADPPRKASTSAARPAGSWKGRPCRRRGWGGFGRVDLEGQGESLGGKRGGEGGAGGRRRRRSAGQRARYIIMQHAAANPTHVPAAGRLDEPRRGRGARGGDGRRRGHDLVLRAGDKQRLRGEALQLRRDNRGAGVPREQRRLLRVERGRAWDERLHRGEDPPGEGLAREAVPGVGKAEERG